MMKAPAAVLRTHTGSAEGFRNEKNVPAIGKKRSERVIYFLIASKKADKEASNN